MRRSANALADRLTGEEIDARRERAVVSPRRPTYRIVGAKWIMHCEECGARLVRTRVERLANGDVRFVCAGHPLPAHLRGREVVRVRRDWRVIDVAPGSVLEGDEVIR